MHHDVVTAEPLIEVLQRMHPEATRNSLRRMLDHGRVRVNGKTVHRAKEPLAPGDRVEVGPAPRPRSEQDAERGVRVLLEDEVVLVAEKPAGMLTVATDKGGEDTLYDRLFEREKLGGGRMFIVHRLDRPTSGVMMFAKDEVSKEKLQTAFAEKQVERVYLVLVEGTVEGESGTVEERLAESETLQVYVTPSAKHGKQAVTHWRVKSRGTHYTLLEVTLGTGRRHQIRVHMAHLGHPVVGDKEHGAVSDPMNRLGLHAHRLVFPHPVTGERVQVSSEAPPAFQRALKSDPAESTMRKPRRHPHGRSKKKRRTTDP